MIKETKEIEFKIENQGAPIINYAYIFEQTNNIVLIGVDLKSKYCEIDCTTGGDNEPIGVYISAGKETIRLNKDVDKEEPTKIIFPEFIGYDIFALSLSRYTLKVCLIKK